jgi:hypothetical protein
MSTKKGCTYSKKMKDESKTLIIRYLKKIKINLCILLFFIVSLIVTLDIHKINSVENTIMLEQNSIINWEDICDDNHDIKIRVIVQTSDGGSMYVGKIRPKGPGDSDIYIAKTDANNRIEWIKTYGEDGYEDAYSTDQTNDGGYIVAGSTTGFGAWLEDIYIVKIDSEGALQWQQTFGSHHSEWGNSIQQTQDGSYKINCTLLVLTDPRELDPGIFYSFILFTDSNGNIVGTNHTIQNRKNSAS